MTNDFPALRYPELVFGIAGAVGIDIDEIMRALTDALAAVKYGVVPIRITDELKDEQTDVPVPEGLGFLEEISYKMSHASAVCRRYGSPDTLMRFAIRAIRRHRGAHANFVGHSDIPSFPLPADQVIPSTAYVIRQLKRPEEVHLLRRVYGKQFILISAYGSAEKRKKIVERSIRRGLPLDKPVHEISSLAEQLMHRDQNEESDDHGQHLRDTFHLADVFVDGNSRTAMVPMINRFVEAFFGRADVAPTRWEYGMYAARSASFRSSDLSRQVGAAIFTADGELITQGCNEVPKAFGGTYWDGDDKDYRDVKLGHDPNDQIKKEVIRDFIERLLKAGMLSEYAKLIGGAPQIVEALINPKMNGAANGHGSLIGSSVMELTEYGRVVHAEMCAICDAARLGRSVKGAILFCTTFPCHNCTKHLLAAGIANVVYMEPYPKSKAKELHENEIQIEKFSDVCVSFLPFLGISPVRYRDVFQKGKRKKDGLALRWLSGEPRPLVDIPAITYIELEQFEEIQLLARLQPRANSSSE